MRGFNLKIKIINNFFPEIFCHDSGDTRLQIIQLFKYESLTENSKTE